MSDQYMSVMNMSSELKSCHCQLSSVTEWLKKEKISSWESVRNIKKG